MNFSETEENYIKAVFYICQQGQDAANTNAIASRLQTKAASVSDMIKKLAEKKILSYEKYKGVSLTKEGKKIALRLVRKHRLWEVFLVEKLGFKWDEVHEMAEQLEHIKSPDLIKRLDAFLDYPKIDPHGDPIPNEDGVIEKIELQKLSIYKENDTVQLMGVADSSTDFLQYLSQLNLSIGKTIKLGKKISFDNSQELYTNEGKIVVSKQVVANLLVGLIAKNSW